MHEGQCQTIDSGGGLAFKSLALTSRPIMFLILCLKTNSSRGLHSFGNQPNEAGQVGLQLVWNASKRNGLRRSKPHGGGLINSVA